MPSYLFLPKDPYKICRSRKERRPHYDMPWWGTKQIFERFERIIWGAKLCLHFQNQMTTQVFELLDARGFESMLFHYSITQGNVVDTSKFTSAGEAWNNLYADVISRRWPDVDKARSSNRYDSVNWWSLDVHDLDFEPRLIQTLTTVTPLLRWLSTTRTRLTSPRRLSYKRIENTSKNGINAIWNCK